MRIKNILSIDFDYFIHYGSRLSPIFCPDAGIEFQPQLSSVIWGTKYAEAKASGLDMSALLSLRIDDLELIKDIVRNQNFARTMICDSHKHMIDFVNFIYEQDLRFTVYNVDAHHDAYPIEYEDDIHCGNWMTVLMDDDSIAEGYWISPEDELHSTALSDNCDPRIKKSLQLRDLSDKGPFDFVFLCKSTSWVPPHLDTAFLELANLLIPPKGGWPCRLQRDVLQDRYNEKFCQEVAEFVSREDIQKGTAGGHG